jgi:hypothetical protein
MAIKPTIPSQVSGVGAADAVRRIDGPAASGFSRAVDAPTAASASRAESPAVAAVRDVASEVRAGSVPREAAVDAVIDRLVDGQLSALPAREKAERALVARVALGDNPGFVERVERMLTQALSE